MDSKKEDKILSTTDNSKKKDEAEKCFKCSVCGEWMEDIVQLQKHTKIHNEKHFSCEFCPKTFTIKENLNVHIRSHTKEKPYCCHICNKGFEHSGKLHRHIRTHTGERPHQCELCDKSFVQSGQLVIHMRAHTGEKPYSCEYCSKGFTCSKQLKVHIRIHTGEKPYQCDICGKTFGYNHVLKMHKRSHLATKMYKCTLCNKFFNTRKSFDRHIKNHNREVQDDEGDEEPKTESNQIQARIYNSSAKSYLDSDYTNTRNSSYCISKPEGILTPPYSPEQNDSIVDKQDAVRERNLSTSDHEPFLYPLTSNSAANSVKYEIIRGNRYNISLFRTLNGETFACPSNFLVKINDIANVHDHLEIKNIENEIDKKLQHETLKLEEEALCLSVVKVLKTCLGEKKLAKLGYPTASIDEVIINTLTHLGAKPCSNSSFSFIDRLKINLELLLNLCVPDPVLWEKFGWKGKPINQIIGEILDQSSQSSINC